MRGFIEEFNLKWLAERRRSELLDRYDLEDGALAIYYDAGRGKWILTYEP